MLYQDAVMAKSQNRVAGLGVAWCSFERDSVYGKNLCFLIDKPPTQV
jgi:hypothetical protein